jgi:hypothetical protein
VEQETILQSFVPDLLVIADSSSSSTTGVDSHLVSGLAQIAELASLAAAAIASRQIPMEQRTVASAAAAANCRTGTESSLNYLQEAEHDLLSDLPPMRARAMVQLRHRTNAISEGKKQRDTINTTANDDDDDTDDDDLFKILLLCMKALNDPESYVYLAAIHTIVAVADSDPSRFVSIIGAAVVTGRTHNNEATMYELSFEQRTKLTEALVFIVRRRTTFYPMLPFLMDLLVLGLKGNEEMTKDEQYAKYIQEATHRYFVTGSYEDDDFDSDNVDAVQESSLLDEYWKELDLRVRTGGPLFALENTDIVRSGMMTVVSELVAVVSTTVTARYAALLVSCCIDTLRWEASRPVRRAGAMLARELYGSLVREQEEFLDAVANQSNLDVPLSMAMVEGREDILFCILQQTVSSKTSRSVVQANGMERWDDPAVNARCEEGIALRQTADEGGIILAGKVALKAQQCDESTYVSRLLKSNKSTSVPLLKIQELYQ